MMLLFAAPALYVGQQRVFILRLENLDSYTATSMAAIAARVSDDISGRQFPPRNFWWITAFKPMAAYALLGGRGRRVIFRQLPARATTASLITCRKVVSYRAMAF